MVSYLQKGCVVIAAFFSTFFFDGCQTPDNVSLFNAAFDNEIDKVNALLEKGVDPDVRVGGKPPPLYAASQGGHAQVARTLIEHGAYIDYRWQEAKGETPLIIAANRGHREVVDILLDCGSNPNFRKIDGTSALYLAAQEGHLAIVKRLIGDGADVNASTIEGYTPLIVASELGRTSVVNTLLQHGAAIDSSAESGATALYFAAQEGHLAIVKRLIGDGADVNASTIEGYTPLMVASELGRTSVVNTLLQHGAAIDSSAENGTTAVSLARKSGHNAIVDILESKGRRLEEQQETAMNRAGDNDSNNTAVELENNFVNTEETNLIKNLDLAGVEAIPAVKSNSVEMPGRLTIEGLFLPVWTGNTKGELGAEYVTGAVKIEHKGATLILETEFSGDRIPVHHHVPIMEGWSLGSPHFEYPLGQGSVHRFKNFAQVGDYLFVGFGDRLNRLTFLLTENGYVYLRGRGIVVPPRGDVIKFSISDNDEAAIRAMADLRMIFTLGLFPAEISAPQIRSLIKAGADPNMKGPRNITPLMCAVGFGDISLVEFLLQKGAKADVIAIIGGKEFSPLTIAENKGYLDIVNLLRESEGRLKGSGKSN